MRNQLTKIFSLLFLLATFMFGCDNHKSYKESEEANSQADIEVPPNTDPAHKDSTSGTDANDSIPDNKERPETFSDDKNNPTYDHKQPSPDPQQNKDTKRNWSNTGADHQSTSSKSEDATSGIDNGPDSTTKSNGSKSKDPRKILKEISKRQKQAKKASRANKNISEKENPDPILCKEDQLADNKLENSIAGDPKEGFLGRVGSTPDVKSSPVELPSDLDTADLRRTFSESDLNPSKSSPADLKEIEEEQPIDKLENKKKGWGFWPKKRKKGLQEIQEDIPTTKFVKDADAKVNDLQNDKESSKEVNQKGEILGAQKLEKGPQYDWKKILSRPSSRSSNSIPYSKRTSGLSKPKTKEAEDALNDKGKHQKGAKLIKSDNLSIISDKSLKNPFIGNNGEEITLKEPQQQLKVEEMVMADNVVESDPTIANNAKLEDSKASAENAEKLAAAASDLEETRVDINKKEGSSQPDQKSPRAKVTSLVSKFLNKNNGVSTSEATQDEGVEEAATAVKDKDDMPKVQALNLGPKEEPTVGEDTEASNHKFTLPTSPRTERIRASLLKMRTMKTSISNSSLPALPIEKKSEKLNKKTKEAEDVSDRKEKSPRRLSLIPKTFRQNPKTTETTRQEEITEPIPVLERLDLANTTVVENEHSKDTGISVDGVENDVNEQEKLESNEPKTKLSTTRKPEKRKQIKKELAINKKANSSARELLPKEKKQDLRKTREAEDVLEQKKTEKRVSLKSLISPRLAFSRNVIMSMLDHNAGLNEDAKGEQEPIDDGMIQEGKVNANHFVNEKEHELNNDKLDIDSSKHKKHKKEKGEKKEKTKSKKDKKLKKDKDGSEEADSKIEQDKKDKKEKKKKDKKDAKKAKKESKENQDQSQVDDSSVKKEKKKAKKHKKEKDVEKEEFFDKESKPKKEKKAKKEKNKVKKDKKNKYKEE